MFSDTHLRLEFHQSIHCTCHCFSQWIDTHLRLEFLVTQSMGHCTCHRRWVLWQTAHLLTGDFTMTVNSLYLSVGFSIRRWWNIYEKQWYSVDSPSQWVTMYLLTGDRRWVLNQTLVKHLRLEFHQSIHCWLVSIRWVLNQTLVKHLRLEFHQSIHCWLVSIRWVLNQTLVI